MCVCVWLPAVSGAGPPTRGHHVSSVSPSVVSKSSSSLLAVHTGIPCGSRSILLPFPFLSYSRSLLFALFFFFWGAPYVTIGWGAPTYEHIHICWGVPQSATYEHMDKPRFLVRLGGYIVNLSDFCSYRLRVYYESIKREPKIRGIKKCRCDERLQTKTKEFTRLPYSVDCLLPIFFGES